MTEFENRIAGLFEELGIPAAIRRKLTLPLQAEATDLVDCGPDIFDRPQSMTGHTRDCWEAMKHAALVDGIELQLVSAFRSVDYQCNLIRNKLDRGLSIEDILRVNAIPGYSEHHTGRALDLSTPGCEPLEEAFERTSAFTWLVQNAKRFSFSMTYPRGNRFGIIYEPWHWACDEPNQD